MAFFAFYELTQLKNAIEWCRFYNPDKLIKDWLNLLDKKMYNNLINLQHKRKT